MSLASEGCRPRILASVLINSLGAWSQLWRLLTAWQLSQLLFVLLTMTSVSMTPEIIPRVILVTGGMFLVTLGPAAAFQPFISVDQEVRIIWDQTKTITRWLDTCQAPAQHQHFSIIQNYGVSSENTENVRLGNSMSHSKLSSPPRNILMVVTTSPEEENSLITPMMMMTMKMMMRITTWWPRARMMRMTSVMTTPAERKCTRGSGMSASSEKSQELCHILLPEREIHTEIFTEIVLLINKYEKN